jgi:hypothetical protein
LRCARGTAEDRLPAFPIDDGGTKAADGVAEIDGVCAAKVFEAQDAFFGAGVGGQDVAALDAGEQAAVDWRGEEAAVFLYEDIVDGAFSYFAALIEEENIVVTGCDCGLEGFSVERAVGGFVEVHGIFGVRALSGDADAEGLG